MRANRTPAATSATLEGDQRAGQLDGEDSPPVWLSLAREIFGSRVTEVTVERLKHSAVSSTVYRLGLTGVETAPGPLRLIAKRTAAAWADDSYGPAREAMFLRHLAPQAGIPQPRLHFAGPIGREEGWLTLVDDVSTAYDFPDAGHPWTSAELRPILATYAPFHTHCMAALPTLGSRKWLFPPYRTRVASLAGELPGMVEALVNAGIWSPLPGIGRLVESTVRDNEMAVAWPETVVHNDVTPANAGLPRNGTGQAMLIDWEMVGTGPAELDLAYMFMQPFDNTRAIDRQAALAWYWEQRRSLSAGIPTVAARAHAQRQADTILALWLIPVALQRLLSPFPSGSAPRLYWDSMSRVLERRLRELCQA